MKNGSKLVIYLILFGFLYSEGSQGESFYTRNPLQNRSGALLQFLTSSAYGAFHLEQQIKQYKYGNDIMDACRDRVKAGIDNDIASGHPSVGNPFSYSLCTSSPLGALRLGQSPYYQFQGAGINSQYYKPNYNSYQLYPYGDQSNLYLQRSLFEY